MDEDVGQGGVRPGAVKQGVQAPLYGQHETGGSQIPPRTFLGVSRAALEAIFSIGELDTLVSLVEMTLEEATVTFADWLESNPEEKEGLETLDAKLREFERVLAQPGAEPVGRRFKTLVTLQLVSREE